MLVEAQSLTESSLWIWGAIAAGIIIGILKIKYIFRRACQNNLHRIQQLKQPKIWQFFRPGFFLFLLSMVILGSLLSNTAHSHFPLLIAMSVLDTSLAVALLGSSYQFWCLRSQRNS